LAAFGRLSTDLIYEQASRPAEQELAQLRKRFLKRAAAEGFSAYSRVHVFEIYKRWRWSCSAAAATAAAALVALVALQFGAFFHRGPTDQRAQGAVDRGSEPSTTAVPTQVRVLDKSATTVATADEARGGLQLELEQSNAREKVLAEQTAQLSAKLAEQRKELEERAALIGSLQKERTTAALQLADALSSLERTKNDKEATEVQLAVQQNEIRDLSEKLRLETAQFDRERALLGKNGQSILAARNLHIIDVYDADGSGKRRKSFGRLFYEEGKLLVFYAYDLSDANHPAPHFYAWGADKSDPHFVARLGILHNDGNGDGRWELTFDNSGVLSKIDSVFVTAESKEVARPKGRRVLFAVLGGVPNHP
jgi:hypothetical protein